MEWISVEDRLPEKGQRIVCYSKYIFIKYHDGEGVFHDGDFHWTGVPLGIVDEVTHWKPLPEPPKQQR